MKKYLTIITGFGIFYLFLILFLLPTPLHAQSFGQNLSGRVLLQVENHGELWYVSPRNLGRYQLMDDYFFNMIREVAYGIKDTDLNRIPLTLNGDIEFGKKYSGKVLLAVQDHGRIWYVDFNGQRTLITIKNYTQVLGATSLGISNNNLFKIPIGKHITLNKGSENLFTNRQNIYYDVPFFSQAPQGNWSDKRQSYGCEEASVLMALGWATNTKILLQDAEDTIIAISDYEYNQYKIFEDTSIKDTYNRIVKGYFKYENAELLENVMVDDIIEQLYKGYLVVAPVNGQILQNPNYRPPGPFEHMLVIVGYDTVTDELITHDPGTRFGKNFRIKRNHFATAFQDYKTGFRLNQALEFNSIIVIK